MGRGGRRWSRGLRCEWLRKGLRNMRGGKTLGKRDMCGEEWRGGEGAGEAGGELATESGESHTLMKGEGGGASPGSCFISSVSMEEF